MEHRRREQAMTESRIRQAVARCRKPCLSLMGPAVNGD
jgi:hypothetical protein